MKIGRRFREALPPATHELLRAIGMLSRDMGYRAYLVGGIVRDLMLGRENADLDIAIEGNAERLAKTFARKTGSRMRAPTRFGTCKLESKAFGKLDVASTRGETYRAPGALPDVHPAGITDDLMRRDFALNAMALSLNPGSYGRLLDPLKGADDLRRCRLRILHEESFKDDPTRMLRGIRFRSRYGFDFDRATSRLFREGVAQAFLGRISGKRLFTELKLLCKEDQARAALMMLRQQRVLESVDSGLAWDQVKLKHARLLDRALREPAVAASDGFREQWMSYLAVFFLGAGRRRGERLTERLSLPGEVGRVCLWTAAGLGPALAKLKKLDRSEPYKVTRLLRDIPPEALVHVYIAGDRAVRNLVLDYLSDWRAVRPALTGDRVMELGVPRGPRVGKMLETLLRLRLSGKLKTRADEIEYVMSRTRS